MKRLDHVDGICAALAQHHIIRPEDVIGLHHAFSQRDDIMFEDFLIEEGIADKNDLLQALETYYKVPALDVVGEFFDHYLIRLVPKDVLLTHLMIPYMRENDNLWVVVAEPDDPHLPVVLAKYLSHNFNFMVGLPQDIRDAIQEYYDESDTYQPYDIANQLMERSAQEVHTPNQLEQMQQYDEQTQEEVGLVDKTIPLIVEETVDDYESK